MIIVGAGMAGLLAAGMLRDEAQVIIEAQRELPNNHSALLRFRSSVVGDVLNIPFKKVSVMKAVEANGLNPIAVMLSYSLKSNGTATMRSSISATGEIDERFIAPPDLVEQMHRKVTCELALGSPWLPDSRKPATISTMPMPILMKLLQWEDIPDFLSVTGYNIVADLVNVDAYCTLYIPDKVRQENRISITGSRLTIEVALPKLSEEEVTRTFEAARADVPEKIQYALEALGLGGTPGVAYANPQIVRQRYAKILPIDESIRRNFIVWASEKHNVFSLGRFATWRPGLLLDDVVQDVRVIQKLVRGNAGYDQRKKD